MNRPKSVLDKYSGKNCTPKAARETREFFAAQDEAGVLTTTAQGEDLPASARHIKAMFSGSAAGLGKTTQPTEGNSREDLIAFNEAKERHGISAKGFHMGDATLREMADFLNLQEVGSLDEK